MVIALASAPKTNSQCFLHPDPGKNCAPDLRCGAQHTLLASMTRFGILFVHKIFTDLDMKNVIVKTMKKLFPLLFLFLLFATCEKSSYEPNSYHLARIVGFDMNCSTCILKFPEDSVQVKEEIGQSPDNLYESINLNKGNYQIGQLLKVKIRTPNNNELNACITLYPSDSYKKIFVTRSEDFDNLLLNDTIALSYKDCLNESSDHFSVCFDSVINESRCPLGVVCFWQGNATARFKFEKYNQKPIFFELNTFRSFTNDTIIDDYKFTLIDLLPYPSIDYQIKLKDYKAQILIEKL